MTRYFQSPHVHFCFRGDSAIILNLREDAYMLATGATVEALRCLSAVSEIEASSSGVLDGINDLVDSGVITAQAVEGRNVAPTTFDFPRAPLIDAEAASAEGVSVGHILRFIRACAIAAARIRWGRLESTVRAVANRRSSLPLQSSMDFERARELTVVFKTLRAYFPKNYLCLYDSLALIEFLAQYGVYPSWIFGVRLDPWGAHCWVQEQGVVFEDDIEEVSSYTPVLQT
jgi:Transglutaminase-like superfamily